MYNIMQVTANGDGGDDTIMNRLASNPGLPHPDFISQPPQFFLQGCEIKSGRGRPGFEANNRQREWMGREGGEGMCSPENEAGCGDRVSLSPCECPAC